MYKFRIEGKRVPKKVNNGLTLARACLKLIGIKDSLVIDEKGLIAFWCSYHQRIKVGYAANEYEKREILNKG